MIKPRLLVLGGGLFQTATIARIAEAGFHVICMDANPQSLGFSISHEHYIGDIRSSEAIADAARASDASGIMPLNDFAVPAAAAAAEFLALPGIDPACAHRATDKGSMRDAWAASSLTQPDYQIIANEKEAAEVARRIGFPCIIKPCYSGGGGRGILILEDGDDILTAYAEALRYALNGRVMIEAFIKGVELTIESLSDGEDVHILAVSDKIKPPLRSRVATDLFYPATIAPEALAAAKALAARAVRSLGITIGAGHTELIVQPDGNSMLVESAARGGGGHITSHIVEWVSGVAFPVEWARQLCGLPASFARTCERAAIYHFFCPPPGRLTAIDGLEEAGKMKHVAAIGALRKIGDEIPGLANSLERSGYLVIQADTRSEAEATLDAVDQRVHFVVEGGTEKREALA